MHAQRSPATRQGFFVLAIFPCRKSEMTLADCNGDKPNLKPLAFDLTPNT